MPETEPYVSGDFNAKLYSQWRRSFDEFFPSEQYYLKGDGALPDLENISILDVGCAAGGLGTAVLDSV
jgi:hypothetical protein